MTFVQRQASDDLTAAEAPLTAGNREIVDLAYQI
jgi:hypothetical protein